MAPERLRGRKESARVSNEREGEREEGSDRREERGGGRGEEEEERGSDVMA